jgi:hypothetical protein
MARCEAVSVKRGGIFDYPSLAAVNVNYLTLPAKFPPRLPEETGGRLAALIKSHADYQQIMVRLSLASRAKFKTRQVLEFSYDKLVENLLICLKLRQ